MASRREAALARVHGIESRPERNGTCVKLGKRVHADMDNERWESLDEFTGTEAQYRPQNLTLLPPLQPLARSLYRIFTTPFLISPGTSNDLIFHVLSHNHELPLMHLFLLLEKKVAKALPLAPQARLDAMREAARELSAVHTGFALARDDTILRRPPLPQSAREHVAHPILDEDAELTALLISATADALPSQITLPNGRLDYLNVLAEQLGAPSVAPYPLGGSTGAQRVEQPVLYVAVGGAEVQARPMNPIASALAGVEVRGDALLSSLEFRDSAGVEGLLTWREPCGLPAVLVHLHRRSGDVANFVDTKLGRPMLGGRTIPRVEAWPVGVEVSGAPCPSPKSLLLEYSQAWPQRVPGAKPTAWAVGSDGVRPPEDGMPPRGFRAGFDLEWPSGAAPPDGAVRSDDGTRVAYQTAIYSRKAASKQDKVLSAEPQATVMLLRALHRRNQHVAQPPPAAAMVVVAAAAAALPSPLFHGLELPNAQPDAAQEDPPAHVSGSMLVVSYTLKLLPTRASALPLAEDAAAVEALLTLEERIEDRVLLGGGVLVGVVEDVMAEMTVGSERRLRVHATLLGQPVACLLCLRLHSSEPPEEEAPQQSHFNVARQGVPGMPHSQERAAFVADLVAGWAPSSLVDVGCGDGKLLEQVVLRRVSAPLLLGADMLERSLRRAGRRLGAALTQVAGAALPPDGGEPPTHAHAPPRVELFRADVSGLHVACEAMTLVEVVEHLDWWDLEELGPALLGRCKPRWLLVTTPNKEYNLNFMQPYAEWQEGTMKVPDVGGYPLRNRDHRFEWTRDEFRAWAEGLAAEFGYTASFHGVGGGPFDERVPYGVWRGPGPQTQAVVFERTSPPSATAAAPYADTAAAPLHEHAGSIVWDSQVESVG